MTTSSRDEKLVWQLSHLDGVQEVDLSDGQPGVVRVHVTVASGTVDQVWDELVAQVDEFERSQAGEAGYDLDIALVE